MTRSHLVVALLAAGAALALGYALGSAGAPAAGAPPATAPDAAPVPAPVWTCSMHPQVRLQGPGSCPICEMPLIPAATAAADDGAVPSLALSERALALASVETSLVERRPLTRELRAVGKIRYNESALATVTARVDGYAERLFVNFTGAEIKAGDHLVEIYSPELLVAQQELLVAARSGGDGGLLEAAALKLRRLGLTREQVDALRGSGEIAERVTLYSPIAGTVIEKSIVQQSAFRAGDALYRVADLDTVWVYLDIYEYDLPWVRYGQSVELVAESLPGRVFSGLVTFVEPIVSEDTRTIAVPVHVENADHALKPGMFVSATIRADLGADGRAAATGVEGRWSCPMHPQVLLDAPGACPICEMHLEQIPGAEEADAAGDGHADHGAGSAARAPVVHACPMACEGTTTYPEAGRCPVCGMRLLPVAAPAPASAKELLVVPTSAVLDSGTRQLVYVEVSRGLFQPREVVLGPRAGDFFPVLEGLADGERVVTRGGFLIDSQFQIGGQSSLFHPGGLRAGAEIHEH